ncbi:hypothetical protein CE91St41_24490 [Oscillospiraceae bacterium]|nr:hypothetical protein CE91St40_13050 [Oscillospiraceae bacterium]BDF75560.1 hypothetical protein CE91St41_24490 [Oscillospiraceae bacterium]
MTDPITHYGVDQARSTIYSPLGDLPYAQILPRVQAALALSISGSVEELSEADLKDKIERYITDNRIKCSLTADVGGGLVNYIYHDMAGLSFITRDRLFERSGFEEININAWNDVEIVSGGQRVKTDYSFLSPQHAMDIHARMLRKTKTIINDVIPRATADIGGGIRITVEKDPILDEDVAVASSIRKVNVADIGREEQEAGGVLLPEMMDLLLLCAHNGVSMCLSGGTGAGKTTLGGCILSIASRQMRTFTIEEDSREWNFIRKEGDKIINSVIHTRTKPNKDNPALSITQEELIKDSLRFDPDIIAPGEIRGREAFEVMGVSNTGHTVITTTHSNGTADTIDRIVTLAKKAFDMSDSTLFHMACRAFPLLVHMELGRDKKRRVTEICEVLGYENGMVKSQMLYEFVVEDNIYRDRKCIETVGHFEHLAPISPALAKHMLKKGATRAELKPFLELEEKSGNGKGVA